ncbi:hypothetical protein ANAPH1_00448 [Anaplasma phagocytophilum]|nr:hypothetical protein ANAPH2_00107 [Anaplasma phagocytophilum]SCV63672.1 hypothetical protein ANAPH1_00448 [Anaplasma phagocytophilum]
MPLANAFFVNSLNFCSVFIVLSKLMSYCSAATYLVIREERSRLHCRILNFLSSASMTRCISPAVYDAKLTCLAAHHTL